MSLSLDLDNKWSYLKTHGSDLWKAYPSYLDVVVPRILEFLEGHGLRITFFVVGQDAELEGNRAVLRMLADAGHDIACHSFNHEPWLHLYDRDQLHEDLQRAETSIRVATGVTVKGFRGPGFSLSATTLSVLREREYAYDATAFPNILNPMARAYFFAHSQLSEEERKRRKALFGSFSDAFRPVKPYRWELDGGYLLELPVTTMPLFKTPIHFSYLIYLAGYAPWLARAYLRAAIMMCKLTGTEPSLLMHPLDFMGREDDSDLSFFPAMKMARATKLALMDGFVRTLKSHFDPVTIEEFVRDLPTDSTKKSYKPRFAHSSFLKVAAGGQHE
jgi:hypothetical protein